jgi:WD40 repeat protein
LFKGFINETDDLGAPASFVYGTINLVDGTINQQRHSTFQSWRMDISDTNVLVSEEQEEFLRDDVHQVHHAVLLFDMATLESRLLELQAGDSNMARFSYDGKSLVTISRDFEYFRKYDLQTGEIIYEVDLEPIPELVEFGQISTSVDPVIIPISDSVYAIALFNDELFGFYGVHQLIELPNEGL